MRERWRLDCVVINGENAAGGFGITEAICDEILAAGADAITLGNHAFDQREALVFIERQPRLRAPGELSRPARRAAAPTSSRRATAPRVLVRQRHGPALHGSARRSRSRPSSGSSTPARCGRVADAIVVDVHAEATSEKQALAYHFDGRASLVVGTHTHVPTADHRILPGGTAYLSDAGMCGDYDSVLGMHKDEPIRRFLQKTPGSRLEPATGEGTLSGVAVETDDRDRARARASPPVRLGPTIEETWPQFWD